LEGLLYTLQAYTREIASSQIWRPTVIEAVVMKLPAITEAEVAFGRCCWEEKMRVLNIGKEL
jgi:hypothetical protein